MTTFGFGGALTGFFFFLAANTSNTTKLRWGFGFRNPFFAGGGFSNWRPQDEGTLVAGPGSRLRGTRPVSRAPHGYGRRPCGGGRCGGRCGGLGGRLATSRLRKSTGAWRWPCQGAGGATYTGFGGGGGGFGGRLSPRGGRAGGARMPRRQFWSLSAVDIVGRRVSMSIRCGGVQGLLSLGRGLAVVG